MCTKSIPILVLLLSLSQNAALGQVYSQPVKTSPAYDFVVKETPNGLLSITLPYAGASSLTFSNTATAAQKQLVESDANTFDFTSYPIPDYAGFKHDCLTDPNAPNFPIAVLYCLLLADPTLTYQDRKALASIASTQITDAYPSQASAIFTQVLKYATARNLPLQ